jgi:hypothetical protein
MMISAFRVFRVANRHTFSAIFDRDLTDPSLREPYREVLGDMVVQYLAPDRPKGRSKAATTGRRPPSVTSHHRAPT